MPKNAIQQILRLLKVKKAAKKVVKQKYWTVVDFFNETLAKVPDNVAIKFISKDKPRSYTFKELDEASNRVANWAKSKGIKEGDVVSLMKTNCPEFVVIWLAMAKLGAATALINHNLTGNPLKNSLYLAGEESKGVKNIVIYGPECEANILCEDILSSDSGLEFWSYTGTGDVHVRDAEENESPHTWWSLDDALSSASADAIPADLRKNRTFTSILFYVYTSGTTGLPKAAKINHLRFFGAGRGFAHIFNIRTTDTVYCALPIYHSAGGMIGCGLSFALGITLVLREKFSATNFFKDCAEHGCTVAQYIGQLCRYILQTKPSEWDNKHKVRYLVGNGLRKDVWIKFQERFHVGKIGEFYAATEGNANLFNNNNKPGAVGHLPGLLGKVYPVKFIKMEADEETVKRNAKGFCIACKPGEIGQAIGLIKDNDPTRRFDGYTNKAATEKKILRNVFKKGDRWFASGDLLRRDRDGYVYFIDRIGDTFRWKGENCSTNEVEEVVGNAVEGIKLANVYGVTVANNDGRAPCVALVLNEDVSADSFAFDELYANCKKNLASYQVPLFVRVQTNFEMTSTHKFKKVKVRDEGYNPANVGDDLLYFRDDSAKTYIPLTEEVFMGIEGGNYRI